ncbi:MAG: M23 family metallopeptidase, partial [Chloroflexi bacterium]|nr:M23 family metallopeptidase [Chloroflexota bacterium]
MRRPADDNLPQLLPAPQQRIFRAGPLVFPSPPAAAPTTSSPGRRGLFSVLAGLLITGALGVLSAGAALDFAPTASTSDPALNGASAPLVASVVDFIPTGASSAFSPLAQQTADQGDTAPPTSLPIPLRSDLPADTAAVPAQQVNTTIQDTAPGGGVAAPPASPRAAPVAQAQGGPEFTTQAAPRAAAAPAPPAPPQQRQTYAVVPVRGFITTEFSAAHLGIDIAAGSGTPVLATAAGVVTGVYDLQTGYGRHIVLDHGDGWGSLYAHLLNVTVMPGRQVPAGQMIGWVGSTGRSTGPHLHFEIR